MNGRNRVGLRANDEGQQCRGAGRMLFCTPDIQCARIWSSPQFLGREQLSKRVALSVGKFDEAPRLKAAVVGRAQCSLDHQRQLRSGRTWRTRRRGETDLRVSRSTSSERRGASSNESATSASPNASSIVKGPALGRYRSLVLLHASYAPDAGPGALVVGDDIAVGPFGRYVAGNASDVPKHHEGLS